MASHGDILVFTDARQSIDKQAVKRLVDNFFDEKVGCVSGELVLVSNKKENNAIAQGLDLYWRYEKIIRRMESSMGCVIGATGALYAIRKSLFVQLRPTILLDDVFIPVKIALKGYKVIFESSACAYNNVAKSEALETARKIKTLVGNWQLFFCLKEVRNPFSSLIVFQFFSHKLLRLLVPYFFLIMLFTSMFLRTSIYGILFVLQLIFYALVTLRVLRILPQIKLIKLAYAFF